MKTQRKVLYEQNMKDKHERQNNKEIDVPPIKYDV